MSLMALLRHSVVLPLLEQEQFVIYDK